MKRKKIKYPVRFNIRPLDYKRHKHYFKILIFDSKKSMFAFYLEYARQSGWQAIERSHDEKYGISKAGTYDPRPRFDAIVLPYVFDKSIWKKVFKGTPKEHKRRTDIGVMLFYKDRIGAGLVAHEFGHAAFWHNRLKLKDECLNLGKGNCYLEEACLYDLAAMVKKFTRKCYEIGLY